MKKLFTLLLIITSINSAFPQKINVYDLCLINQITEISYIHYFLLFYKDFKYMGDYGVNDAGWHIYKFSNNENIMEIGTSSGEKDGQLVNLTDIHYNIFGGDEYDYFMQSLTAFKFQKSKDGFFDDGTYYETWSGTNSLNDMMTLITISKKGDIYIVYIMAMN